MNTALAYDTDDYTYIVDGIEWPRGKDLPSTACIGLDDDLVHSSPEDWASFDAWEAAWEEVILNELTVRFGVRPVAIGGYEPAEEN